MSQIELDGLKGVVGRFHRRRGGPAFARELLTPMRRLGDLDAAYAALERDGLIARAGAKTEMVIDEFGQRHHRPLFVSAGIAEVG